MKTSPAGIAFIARWERCALHVYQDQSGKWTIGVGHLIRVGEDYSGGITHDQAMALLASDVAIAEGAVDQVKRPLTQNQYDACVSLAFNIGAGAEGFAQSTVRRRLDAGDVDGAAAGFLLWDKREPRRGEMIHDPVTGTFRPPKPKELVVDLGLLARRHEECAIFLSP